MKLTLPIKKQFQMEQAQGGTRPNKS